MPVLITGIGRSSTGYVARLFSALHRSCGHEVIFNIDAVRRGGLFDAQARWGDSSWLAAPLLSTLPADWHIIHLVRHPHEWLRSWLAKDTDEAHLDWIAEHTGLEHATAPDVDTCARLYVTWNYLVERSGRGVRVQAESLWVPEGVLALTASLGMIVSDVAARRAVETAQRKDAHRHTKNYGAWNDPQVTDVEALEALNAMGRRYGYVV